MKVTVGISNRHVHLTKDSYEYLFDKEDLSIKRMLNQVGEFAAEEMVNLEYDGTVIENVRIVGPFRDRNQLELLGSDIERLGIEVPIRRSGALDDTPSIRIVVGEKSLETDGVIRAEKHVHVPTSRQDELGLHERDVVKVFAPKSSFLAKVKVSDNGYFELHIDRDEASEYGLQSGEEVELELCGK